MGRATGANALPLHRAGLTTTVLVVELVAGAAAIDTCMAKPHTRNTPLTEATS
jgi:hypothetical protein